MLLAQTPIRSPHSRRAPHGIKNSATLVIAHFSSDRTTMASPPVHLIVDWDGTLTTSSTLPLIAQIGYNRNASSALPSWKLISEAYLSDYRGHASAYKPAASDRKTVKQELEWLESLRDVERKSMERAEVAGIFKGVETKDVQRAAEQAVREGRVVLREDGVRMVKKVLQDGGKVGVISVG